MGWKRNSRFEQLTAALDRPLGLDRHRAVWQCAQMVDVEVTTAEAHEEAALQNLIQLYAHEFSENWAGTDRGDVDPNGRFPAYALEPYWTSPSHVALWLRNNGQIAGFALINDHSRSGSEIDSNVAEFFVLRKYRHAQVGTAAAHAMFSLRPGIWEVAVARKNRGALQFWRKAISCYPSAEQLTELDLVSEEWNGPLLRFHVSP